MLHQPYKINNNIKSTLVALSITAGSINKFHTCNMHQRVTHNQQVIHKTEEKKNATGRVRILKSKLRQSSLDFKI